MKFWEGKGYEKGQCQPFWLSLLRDVLGVEHPEQFITFEDQVHLDHTSFIDGMISATHVMVEQKGLGKDLNAPIKQSDGSLLSPFQQAKRYASELPYSQRPRYIVTSNFAEFYIYDMENPQGEPQVLLLKDLPKEYYRLKFLTDTGDAHIQKEMEISIQAGQLVGKLYDALVKKYKQPMDEQAMQSLNILCVRLVFCLYAEDAGVFNHLQFHDYLAKFNKSNVRLALIELFKTLNTKVADRDQYMDETLMAFPYVNGGLFADESVIIPQLDESIVDLILNDCSVGFDWSEISPTIFGAVFESTLNPETRRKGGMHYTSIENIHKVIDPLFLDDLKEEFEQIKSQPNTKKRDRALTDFQNKLACLKFLDPACGSGNFLTETYICLRKLENEVISLLQQGEMVLVAEENPIKVSISQFYGIEINDFAVTVSMTALWIAESQMMKATEGIVHMDLDFLPLKTNAYIIEGNALRMDWNRVVPASELNYIMGNPPFVGYSNQSVEQKQDMLSVYVDEKNKPYKTAGKIDYVSGWYFKASAYIQNTTIRCAFVSTNSITQGEQVASVWKPLYERFNIHIDFAWRTFKWDSESTEKAAVHVVIIGFSSADNEKIKCLFEGSSYKKAQNINPYLTDSVNVFIEKRTTPLSDVPKMVTGNRPADGGHLIIEADDYDEFIAKEPNAVRFIKMFVGSDEFINNKKRYCLWLVGVSPAELRSMPLVMERINACRMDRLNGAEDRKKLADTPSLFRETKCSKSFYLVVPKVSSENRRYVPIGYVSPEIICSDLVFIILDATLYHFGILTSNVHMAWMRAVAGRLEMRYRYSKDIVYNNFPWPEPTGEQRAKIEQTAQAILDARAKYPDSSLADLYDELTMPPELRKAHQNNDKAVMEAYGFDYKNMTESQCVAELMKLYQKLVEKK